MRVQILFAATGLLFALTAPAAPLTVINPGFEDISEAESTFNEFTFGSLMGWTVYDPNDVTDGGMGNTYFVGTLTPQILPERDPVNYQNFPAGAPDGQRVGIAFNFDFATPGDEYGLQQTLGDSLQANTHYSLNVLVGNIASGWSVSGDFFDLSGFPGYRIDLMAGDTVLASDDNSLDGTIPEGDWGLSTVEFTTGAAHPALGEFIRIRLVNFNLVDPLFPDADREVDFDAVTLNATAVPEPATTALFVAAGLAWFAVKRRRETRRRSRMARTTEMENANPADFSR